MRVQFPDGTVHEVTFEEITEEEIPRYPGGISFSWTFRTRQVDLARGRTIDRLLGSVRDGYYPEVRQEARRAGRHRREPGELGTPTGTPDVVADPE